LAAGALLLSAVPYLFALAIQPEGTLYLGVHSNFDDHAVYAAWAKQAQEGRFFFENRFTTDRQPSLTVNFYFFLVGNMARIAGLPLAMHLAKAAFGLLFLMALYRLARRLGGSELSTAIAMATAIFGAGIGWLFWRRYGLEGPTDVWQPEAFTFPSLMQNGLFCAALWLICVVWNCILDAEESWRRVLPGAAAALVLTNIHTYDMLTIAIGAAGLLMTTKRATGVWVGRSVCIALGALPAIAWFVYVRANDPVFLARSETPTFSPPFLEVVQGYLPLLALAVAAVSLWISRRAAYGLIALVGGMLLVQASADHAGNSAWLGVLGWGLLFIAGLAVCYLARTENSIYGLLFAWAVMGFIALYYPGLFQRKLAMGLSIPLGLMAGWAIAQFCSKISIRDRAPIAAVFVGAVSISSMRWVIREAQMAADNISNTTVEKIYWSEEVARMLTYFQKNKRPDDAVLAMPGVPLQDEEEIGVGIPDLNPVLTGWAGVKSWAGHWSETPDYVDRRKALTRGLYSRGSTLESAEAVIRESKATYFVVPVGDIAAFVGVPSLDFYSAFGRQVLAGNEYVLFSVSSE
jgi:arabinosyltransferase C